jgi:beta-fructofuranosidase
MQLTIFQQRLLSWLEAIPTGVSEFERVSFLEHSQIQVANLVTWLLRSRRSQDPMNWDPWILQDGDLYRLFYLQGVEGHTPWWTFSKICGAISEDLQHWQDLGTLLEPEPSQAWESGRVCAGCAYQADGVYYLFYSAGGQADPYLQDEAIGLAVSKDGLYWQRQLDGYPLHPDARHPWYAACNWTGHFHWRDPYVFQDPRSGKYYLFICASAATPGNFQGCIGLAVADRVAGPYEILPPAVAPTPDSATDWPYYHMERPQVFYKDDRYHLLFSCFRVFLNPSWRHKLNSRRITNSSLYWYVADQITGPYHPIAAGDAIVPGSEKTGLYGINLLPLSPDLNESIAYGWYHRLHKLAVAPTFRATWAEQGLKISSDYQLVVPFTRS